MNKINQLMFRKHARTEECIGYTNYIVLPEGSFPPENSLRKNSVNFGEKVIWSDNPLDDKEVEHIMQNTI